MSVVDITFAQWLALALEERHQRINDWQNQGISVIRLARIWEVTPNQVYRYLNSDVRGKAPVEDQVLSERLSGLIAAMPDGISKDLITIASRLMEKQDALAERDELRETVNELSGEVAALRSENAALRGDLEVVLAIREKHKEVC